MVNPQAVPALRAGVSQHACPL